MGLANRAMNNVNRIEKLLSSRVNKKLTSYTGSLRFLVGLPAFVLALLFEIIFFSITGEGFLTISNLLNLLRQGSVLAIVSIGMTYVILCAEIDLSCGAIISLCGVLVPILVSQGYALFPSCFFAIFVGVLTGLFNGLLTAKARIPSFIVTLGVMGMAKGIALVLTDAESVKLPQHWFFKSLGDGHFLFIPNPVWITGLIFLFGFVLLNRTKFGFQMYEVGSNENAAFRMGTDIVKVKVLVFVLSGLLSSLAGIMLITRMNSAHPTVGIGYEFEAIAATVLGGTIFEGGKGSLGGTMAGVVIITILRNGLNMMGLFTSLQLTIFGLIIILALSFDYLHYKGKPKTS